MTKKYEFTGKTKTEYGVTFKQIRALVAITSISVTIGDIGGWIESEKNLSQVSGNAWVSGNGLIFWASKVGSENGTLTVYNTKDNTLEVTRGCFRGSIDAFLEASEKKHDDQTHIEYRLLIEVAHSRITRALNKD